MTIFIINSIVSLGQVYYELVEELRFIEVTFSIVFFSIIIEYQRNEKARLKQKN